MKTKKKILTVIGARPQFIKSAVVSREFTKHDCISEVVVHTGQHYDHNMSDVFFREMDIPEPAYNLGIKSALQGQMTGRMLEGIEAIILEEKPDGVIVYGDTNSTLAAAIAAAKLHVKLIHIEAGLRSFNMYMPEEVNRILTDRISSLLFCPSEIAMRNLKNEGFEKFDCRFVNSGDVMLDASIFYSKKIDDRISVIDKLKLKEFVLCTVHRAENTNDPVKLKDIIFALNTINRDMPVVLPMHPRTKKNVEALSLKIDFTVIEPIGYLDMLKLLKDCSMVMTDSGVLQKEAYFFKKSCICLRNDTEWTELLDSGHLVLTGSDVSKITEAFLNNKKMPSDYSEVFYGDGNASKLIVGEILKM